MHAPHPAPQSPPPTTALPGSMHPFNGETQLGWRRLCQPAAAGRSWVMLGALRPRLPLTSRLYLATTLPMELVAVQT